MADRIASAGAGFLVEDFITSITTQLDRVQDALRIKAVNRPLTYALKELHLELKVFVDVDAQRQVLLRAAGPNEAGASTLAMDFTTITKPMIEENTISLAATRSTPLEKLGLNPGEQMRLERLGVSNLAQLERLKGSTGVSTVARLAELPVDRLRRALQAGVPKLAGVDRRVQPEPPPKPAPATPPRSVPPIKTSPPFIPPPRSPAMPTSPLRPGAVNLPGGVRPRALRPQQQVLDAMAMAATDATPGTPAEVLEVDPAIRRLALAGSNLLHEDYAPEVRLNGEALEIEELDADRLVVRLPDGFEPGALEVRLGAQTPHCFALVHPLGIEATPGDPWTPASRGLRDEA